VRLGTYRDVLGVRPFRRLFLGQAISGLGDGCGFIAVAWMALELAQPAERPYAVGLAIAAYSLPGALVGLAIATRLADVQPRFLLAADSLLRFLLLGAIPVLHLLGHLPLAAYIALLASSSLLSTAGRGGVVTVVAGIVPDGLRFGANALLASTESIAVWLIGPALGGVLVATVGARLTIAFDAVTFLALLWAAAGLPAIAMGPGPQWPLAFLVTSVRKGKVDDRRFYIWDRDKGNFVESPFSLVD